MANAWGRVSEVSTEEKSLVDVSERSERTHVDVLCDVNLLLLVEKELIEFDRSSDLGCWNAVVVPPPPSRRKRSVNMCEELIVVAFFCSSRLSLVSTFECLAAL